MTDGRAATRAHLRAHFARQGVVADPDSAEVTFLGVEPIEVLRFGPDRDGVSHYVSLGGSGAEVVVSLRPAATATGLARSVAVLAAAPAVEGLILAPDALVDFGQRLWAGAPFTAFLLGHSTIGDLPAEPASDHRTAERGLPSDHPTVVFVQATPITATEAAWVRLKGPEAMRRAWHQDGVDVLDPGRSASSAGG